MISVIVPVYNVEKYLKKCINSIINQSFKKIEIILINDGSTDKSGVICDKLAKQDLRIKVIHQENAGVSVARNVGIELAQGEYICFVDSDDYLPYNAIEVLYNQITENNVDLCCGSWTKITAIKTKKNDNQTSIIDLSDKEAINKYMRLEEVNGPVAKLYKRDIILDNNLRFAKGIKIGEDAIFNYQYINKCKQVMFVSDNVYYYNKLNSGSATHSYYSDFNLCSLQTAVAQSEVLLCEYVNNNSYIVQQVFSDRFISAINYLSYYNLEKIFYIEELKRTCEMFEPYFIKKIISENSDFSKVNKIYIAYQKGDEALYECCFKKQDNKTLISVIKTFIYNIISKCKILIYIIH